MSELFRQASCEVSLGTRVHLTLSVRVGFRAVLEETSSV